MDAVYVSDAGTERPMMPDINLPPSLEDETPPFSVTSDPRLLDFQKSIQMVENEALRQRPRMFAASTQTTTPEVQDMHCQNDLESFIDLSHAPTPAWQISVTDTNLPPSLDDETPPVSVTSDPRLLNFQKSIQMVVENEADPSTSSSKTVVKSTDNLIQPSQVEIPESSVVNGILDLTQHQCTSNQRLFMPGKQNVHVN
jgi:hypothetical protein